MSVVSELTVLLGKLEKTEDYLEISDIGDKLWDMMDTMDSDVDPAVLPLIEKALDSEAAVYFMEKAIPVVAAIGGAVAERILVTVKKECSQTDEENFKKSAEFLATMNPAAYIGDVDSTIQFSVLNQLAKSESLDVLKAVIEKVDSGVHLVSDMKMSLLWVALDANNAALCRYLLDAGVDVSLKNGYGETVEEYASKINNNAAQVLINR